MIFDIVSIFPDMFRALTESGITQRALNRGFYQINCVNPRDFTTDPRRTVDDRVYGGGPGMVMMPEPLDKAIDFARNRQANLGVKKTQVIYLSPQGSLLNHQKVMNLKENYDGLILLCGRYEGIDERVIQRQIDEEISIGDYVLSGGELAGMVLMDSLIRQIDGVLGDQQSAEQDSFVNGLLDCPHYTRPEVYQGLSVPEILLSGHHANIEKWRHEQALLKTAKNRPDLLKTYKKQ